MPSSNVQKVIIVVIICLLLSHIISVHMYNKHSADIEQYNNSPTLNKINTDCDCYDSISRKDKLFTPTAVNIPIDNAVFNTKYNIESKDKMKITGKYCFPIEKYLYDGIWDGVKTNINNPSNKQTLKWDITRNKQIEDIYCGDKLLILPEKRMLPGDVIMNKYDNSCNVNFPKPAKCRKRKFDDDIKKTTFDKHTINGL